MKYRINIFGLFDVPCGLCVAACGTAALLERSGHDVNRVTVCPNGRIVDAFGLGPADINLFHVNPDTIYRIVRRLSYDRLRPASSLNVCIPFWELPVLPRGWAPVLANMDLVLAPSRFVEGALTSCVPECSLDFFPQAVRLPARVLPDRASLGIQGDTVCFVVSLSLESSVQRKNPEATIRAFAEAFPERDDVLLIVRIQSLAGAEHSSREIERLRRLSGPDSRIRFLEGPMSYQDILSLYASADVYVSLHRSEGLGLGPMEAMTLGKPVIATAWSGNMDFMTTGNSMPVNCRLVPVMVDISSPYGRRRVAEGASWAEPDSGEAVRAMRALADDQELRWRLGEQAKNDMSERLRRYEADQVTPILEREMERLRAAKDERSSREARWKGLRSRAVVEWWLNRPVDKLASVMRVGGRP